MAPYGKLQADFFFYFAQIKICAKAKKKRLDKENNGKA